MNKTEKNIYTISNIPNVQEANTVMEDFLTEGMKNVFIKKESDESYSVSAEEVKTVKS